MSNDVIKQLERLLNANNNISDLERALGNRDQDIRDLENALGMQKQAEPDGALVEIHRSLVGKVCGSVLIGYVHSYDNEWVYLTSVFGGPKETKVHISTITDIKAFTAGYICIEPE